MKDYKNEDKNKRYSLKLCIILLHELTHTSTTNKYIYIYIIYIADPSVGQDMTQGQFLSGV